jgi:hypothetical protein
MKTLSLIMLGAVGMSLQAMAASSENALNGEGSSLANSMAPSGFFNADAVNDTSYLAVIAPGFSGDSVVTSGAFQMNGNPMQDFSAIAASSTDFNNNIGTETIKVLPEPTTLALTTLGGLSALVFTRHFRKSGRA